MTKLRFALLAVTAAAATAIAYRTGLDTILPTTATAGKQLNDAYLVASEQLVKPWRPKAPVKGRPSDLAIDTTGTFAALLNGSSIVTINLATGTEISRIAARTTSYLGIAFRPNSSEIWASEATRNGPDSLLILHYSPDGRINKTERLNLNDHPIPAGLAFTPDGSKLYAAFHHDNQTAEIDAAQRKILRKFDTGLAPFALALNGNMLYISNRAGKIRPGQATAPSGKADLPVDATGSVLPGTVTILDLATSQSQSIEAGLAPAGLALSPDAKTLVVANSHSDTLTILDTATRKSATLPIDPKSNLPGLLPNHIALRKDGRRFYVALGGDNSIAVYGNKNGKWNLEGKIPTGWFPTAVQTDLSNNVHITAVKGTGNDDPGDGKRNSRVFEGLLSSVPDPTPAQLAAGMREAKAAADPQFTSNGGVRDLSKLGIQHVFLLIKENRTYDQVFGDMLRGNNDPKLVMYGRDVTPNHHALAEKYIQFDNFYASGAISFEGHQWLMMGFVSDHVERALQAAPRGYAWNMGDALTVSPAGFFWQDQRKPLSVRLLGPVSLPARPDPSGLMRDIDEGQMLTWSQHYSHFKNGTWKQVVGSKCAVPALAPLYDEAFPPSSMRVPDVLRAAAFKERLTAWEAKNEAPNLTIVTMTSDHTMGRSPGAPRPRSMVADNDYALGQIVEAISKSRFWSKSLILAVEDDAQDGVDHVSGRRTVALAVGPTVRRGQLDSNYYTQISLVRTIQDIYGIQPRTRFLANSRAMNSIFTTESKPDTYTAIEPKIQLDDMNPPPSALNGREQWAALASAKMNWDEVDDVPTGVLNRILWWDAKGFQTPYPAR